MSVLGKIVGQLEEGSNILPYYYALGCYTIFEFPEGSIFDEKQDHVSFPTSGFWLGADTDDAMEMTINGKTITPQCPYNSELEFENYKMKLWRETGSGNLMIYLQSDNLPVEGTLKITNIKFKGESYPDETIHFKILPCDMNSDQIVNLLSVKMYMKEQGYDAD